MSPDRVQAAARFLHALGETSKSFAKAKGELVATEKYVGIVEAQLKSEKREQGESVAAAEVYARAHSRYKEAVEAFSAATEQAVALDWEMRIAQWRIELLRTEEASRRVEMQHLHGVT